jgi:molybdopterin-guanine dinucleotide biosynthesis protein MobB
MRDGMKNDSISDKVIAPDGRALDGPAPEAFSIAILTGGESTRMGNDKASLELAGKPLAQHVIDAMKLLSDDLFIVGNDVDAYRDFGLPVCGDLHATRSSLVGVYAAIAASRRDLCLVVSCDMPFIDPALARLMRELSTGYDAVVPVSPAGLEPLYALYNRSCLETMGEFIKRRDHKLINVLEQLRVHWIAPADMGAYRDPSVAFFNINTPEDLRQAETMLPALGDNAMEAAASLSEAPLVCFVGHKDSGKTTLIEGLVDRLSAAGLRIACIKHDVHGFQMDHRGTDTHRLYAAGAREVTISAPDRYARIVDVDQELSLGELREQVGGGIDIILAEGFKGSNADRIEVYGGVADGLACPQEELIAVVADSPPGGVSLPLFGRGEVDAVARFIISRYGLEKVADRGNGS